MVSSSESLRTNCEPVNHSLSRGAILSSCWSKAILVLCLVSALGAYSLGSIPIEIIGSVAWIFLLILLMLTGKAVQFSPLFVMSFLLFSGWTSFVTGYNVLVSPANVPIQMTTPLFGYLLLRLFGLFAFAAVVMVVFYSVNKLGYDLVARRIVVSGVIVSVISLYIYLAQIHGWPEPTRTRMGTSGGGQSTVFSYAFHRAMGTFREPSHFAEWFIIPLFLSFQIKMRRIVIARILMASCLLLTGSLTGIASAVIGISYAVFLTLASGRIHRKGVVQIAAIVVFSSVIFNFLVQPYSGNSASLFSVIYDRLQPILDGGMTASNRGYVYEYMNSIPAPILGSGMGLSNLNFAESISSAFPVSFLSLYFNIYYSAGILGLILLVLLLAIPFVPTQRLSFRISSYPGPLVGAYVAWLVTFAVHSEELSVSFGIIYGLMLSFQAISNKELSGRAV